jgi:glycine C-acetyltransferase
MEELKQALERRVVSGAKRALLVTDGIFSMRGDHAPLDEIMEIDWRSSTISRFEENVVVVVDDSHGVGAFGATGRGTEEYTKAPRATSWWARWARRSA